MVEKIVSVDNRMGAVMRTRQANGEGSVRKIGKDKYECVVQSKYLNEKGKPKRFKRTDNTEEGARKKAKMAMRAWEKAFRATNKSEKISRTTTFGKYMGDFMEQVVEGSVAASTYMNYLYALKSSFYGFRISRLQLHMLNEVEFKNFYNELLEIKSEKSIRTPKQLCVRCCDWLVNRSLLDENYAKTGAYGIKKEVIDEYDREKEERERTRKKVFSNEDIEKFYRAYKNGAGEYAAVTMFLLETGMRLQEFCCLRNSNIDKEKRIIHVRESSALRFKDSKNPAKGLERYKKHPKTGKDRDIYISDLCLEVIEYMQEKTKMYCKNNEEDLLYPSFITGKARSTVSCGMCFRDLCIKLDIDRDIRMTKAGRMRGLSLHDLRHTAISIANSQRGVNIVETALQMGHTVKTETEVYTHQTELAAGDVLRPSEAVLKDYSREEIEKGQGITEEEEYALYMLLKKKFGV